MSNTGIEHATISKVTKPARWFSADPARGARVILIYYVSAYK